ncbi:MAG: flagellar protein export ATPase FliI [Candidatus Marinimicrobia bacterium]|nr:flagellar protein export ATPase FliI [Candidatus Neomarinimicrobiota bacterium]MCF7841160.1 flagellar protein export ATPase FliI [Candidatus Neomarinimicrobiota bacterium]
MNNLSARLARYSESLSAQDSIHVDGRVTQVIGMVIEASLPQGTLGDICNITTRSGSTIRSEIVGFKRGKVLLMPLAETLGIFPGSRVTLSPTPLTVAAGESLLGRILDGLGNPIDGKGPLQTTHQAPVYNTPPNPLKRRRIKEPLATGVRAVDGLLTLGKGQRVGIFAGSGVGKSVLLGMMARYTTADVNVIALIGERGREVRDFIESNLRADGLARSILVVATSDQAAMVRIKGALIATAMAESFRAQGKNVLLLMDSLTRVAMAQREIGLAVGEPPTAKGYTPSVFSLLPQLLERAGTDEKGSITGLYTVLVEGDDMDEPISDASRAILDGHIVLSRKLATRNHYPAIDVLESVSRLKNEIITPDHNEQAGEMLELLASYRDSEDLINIGAYTKGSNPRVDRAIKYLDQMQTFLRQDMGENTSFAETKSRMASMFNREGQTTP